MLKRNFWIMPFMVMVLSMTMVSCEDDESSKSQVLTEDILYLSGESVRMLGRILSIESSSTASNHGFLISENDAFTNSIEISLGETNSLGRFVAETSNLIASQNYFARTFVDVNGQRILGNVLSFSTLTPSVSNFQPNFGNVGNVVTIAGANIDDDIQVFFGSQEAEILEVEFESRVSVLVPTPVGDAIVPVTLIVSGVELTAEGSFEYVTGKWQEEYEFISNTPYSETFSVVNNDVLLFGLGKNDINGQLNNSIWALDLNNGSWTQGNLPSFGRYPYSAGGYFGGGAINFLGTRVHDNSFYFFNGSTIEVKEPTPFNLYQAAAVEDENYLYVFGGILENLRVNKSIYRFDKSSEVWDVIGETVFDIINPQPHFIYDGFIYVLWRERSRIWRYSLENNNWEAFIEEIPFEVGSGGLAVVVNDEVFFGKFFLDQNIYELELDTKEWKIKNPYPGSRGDVNNGFFAFDNKLYLLKNPFASQEALPMKIWSFDPNQLKD